MKKYLLLLMLCPFWSIGQSTSQKTSYNFTSCGKTYYVLYWQDTSNEPTVTTTPDPYDPNQNCTTSTYSSNFHIAVYTDNTYTTLVSSLPVNMGIYNNANTTSNSVSIVKNINTSQEMQTYLDGVSGGSPNASFTCSQPKTDFNNYFTGQTSDCTGNSSSPMGSSVTNGFATLVVNSKPSPDVLAISKQTFCNTDVTQIILFKSSIQNTKYVWTNDNTSIGLNSSGLGDIPSFTATNTSTSSSVSSNIEVTPYIDDCIGTPQNFVINVNPTPDVLPVSNQEYCNKDNSSQITFQSSVNGTTYTWINDNTTTGLQASGNGNILPFTTSNSTQNEIVSNVTVTPTLNNCVGKPVKFTISVKPTPNVQPINNQSYCDGTTTNSIVFNSSSTGTTYKWVNDNTSSGLGASGSGNLPSFAASNTTSTVITSTITVTPTANNCSGTPLSFTITISPTPSVNLISNLSFCNSTSTNQIIFTSSVSGTTYNWTNDNSSTGLATSGSGNIASFLATNTSNLSIASKIIVTPSANGCTTGTAKSFTITINPTPAVQQESNQTYCNGSYSTYLSYNSLVSGTTYTWTNDNTLIGLASSGSGNISSFVVTNNFTSPISGRITVTPTANGCTGAVMIYNITINPTPNIQTISNPTYCNGSTTNKISLISSLSGTTYSWVNDNNSIGLPSSGTGDIPSFTATNTTSLAVLAHITVTPTASGCQGPTYTFTITIKPNPTLNPISDLIYCNSSSTNLITFTSSVSGTTYNWTNDNSSTGLATSGSGNIASFSANNNTNHTITSKVTVTPTANGCAGSPVTFSITINPTTIIDNVPSQTYCSGSNSNNIIFSSSVSGTTYNWTNDNISIGASGSGTGNLTSFATTNSSAQSINGHITVTPIAKGCSGVPISFTITVNPTPSTQPIPDQYYCNAATTSSVTFNSLVTGTTYTWSNNNTTTGLSASGVGNLPKFTATNTSSNITVSNISVTPSSNGCIGQTLVFSINVNPTPSMQTIPNTIYCAGVGTNQIIFSSPTPNTTYSWINDNMLTGLSNSNTGNIASFTTSNTSSVIIVSNITVTPTANGCVGNPFKFTLSVNPIPTVSAIQDYNYCNKSLTTNIQFNSPVVGTTYNWTNNNSTIGLVASGNGIITSFTTADTSYTNTNIGNIIVTPSANNCIGLTNKFNIIINPTSVVEPIANKIYCNGVTTGSITFKSSTPGTIYKWANDSSSIGLDSVGTSSIPSFVTSNISMQPVTPNITVYPSANGCTGTPLVFTIKVNPQILLTSTLNPDPVCDSTYFYYNPTSSANGTQFTWQRAKVTGIQNIAASGVGNIIEILVNNTSYPISVIYIITEIANGCTNTQSITVIVNPTPFLSFLNRKNSFLEQFVCQK